MTRKTKKQPAATQGRTTAWVCPACRRQFSRAHQAHACGAADQDDRKVVRNRPEAIVQTYDALAAFAKTLGPVEIYARERYVLLRTVRIFADLVIMTSAVRVAIHLPRQLDDPLFIKVVADRHKVSHIALLTDPRQLDAIKPYLREAHTHSLR